MFYTKKTKPYNEDISFFSSWVFRVLVSWLQGMFVHLHACLLPSDICTNLVGWSKYYINNNAAFKKCFKNGMDNILLSDVFTVLAFCNYKPKNLKTQVYFLNTQVTRTYTSWKIKDIVCFTASTLVLRSSRVIVVPKEFILILHKH